MMDLLLTLVNGFLLLTNVTMNTMLDALVLQYLPLSLLGELFPRRLLVRNIGQPVIFARKDIFSN